MLRFIRDNINGILGTVVFHLIVVVVIMATRLSSVEQLAEERMFIEFETGVSEEDFQKITEAIQNEQSDQSDMQPDDGEIARNIAVNVSEERPIPDQFQDMSSEDLSELDDRVSEILNNAANGVMPELEQPDIAYEDPANELSEDRYLNEDSEPYSGPTTITYDLSGRTHLRMPVPVYKCPDGGVVEVNITVDRRGRVINANINSSPGGFNQACIEQMAMDAALGSRFSADPGAPEVQSGTITFYFQQQ